MDVKYPEIEVQLLGEDGNAFWILGRVREALLHANVDIVEIEAFVEEATAGSYDELLQTVMRTVTVL